MVVVGDRSGRVAWGYGKANEVPPAVEKAAKEAEKTLKQLPKISMKGAIDPASRRRQVRRQQGDLVPAGPGTGVKAGPGVRDVLVAAGIHNILTKVHGSTNAINLVKATIDGLKQLRTREEVAQLRGVTL